ncbi:MAG: hypothetical protein AAF802_01870 [Planctomycetota bacterium]
MDLKFGIGMAVSVALGLFGFFVAVAIAVGTLFWERNAPVHTEVVQGDYRNTYDVELSNSAITTYRVTAARFEVTHVVPPSDGRGSIELETVFFEPEHFDQASNSFFRTLKGVEIAANGNLDFRFFIRNSGLRNHTFVGRLTVYYGERSTPKEVVIEDFPIVAI